MDELTKMRQYRTFSAIKRLIDEYYGFNLQPNKRYENFINELSKILQI